MPEYVLNLGPPYPKQTEIINYLFKPEPDKVKQVHVCCGLGFGKTTLCIDIACRLLSMGTGHRILFLEPDPDKLTMTFLEQWIRIVPPELYHIHRDKQCITWKITGDKLWYKHRNVHGSQTDAANKFRGIEFTVVMDDEASIKTNIEFYLNNLARLRIKNEVRFYLTVSTPRVGAYNRLIKSNGHKVFYGKTADNPYLPKNYVEQLIANMSPAQIERELMGRMVALEGRIWQTAKLDEIWPHGNTHGEVKRYDPRRPWWLFCDLGSATGAYVVVQQYPATRGTTPLFDGKVWVAVADLCSDTDASATRAFRILHENFGMPAGIVAGKDVDSRDRGDGHTVSYFARRQWGARVMIYPCDEDVYNKQIQYDRMNYLVCDASGNRRFCVAKEFVELDPDTKRGVLQMFEEDAWPTVEKRRPSDFLPKNSSIRVQHVRDALLMGAAQIMSPPKWMETTHKAG